MAITEGLHRVSPPHLETTLRFEKRCNLAQTLATCDLFNKPTARLNMSWQSSWRGEVDPGAAVLQQTRQEKPHNDVWHADHSITVGFPSPKVRTNNDKTSRMLPYTNSASETHIVNVHSNRVYHLIFLLWHEQKPKRISPQNASEPQTSSSCKAKWLGYLGIVDHRTSLRTSDDQHPLPTIVPSHWACNCPGTLSVPASDWVLTFQTEGAFCDLKT